MTKGRFSVNSLMKYRVFDNENPAEFPELGDWNKSIFDTFEEAKEYAKLWMGEFIHSAIENLQLNVPVTYNGYGDTIEIREIPDSVDFLEKLKIAKFMVLDCEGWPEPSCYTRWEIFARENSKEKRISFTNRKETAFWSAHTDSIQKVSENCYQHRQFKIYFVFK